MKVYDVIGYAFEAAYHCPSCTWAVYGQPDGDVAPEDHNGDHITPMFAGDEYSPDGEYCYDCGEEIVEPNE